MLKLYFRLNSVKKIISTIKKLRSIVFNETCSRQADKYTDIMTEEYSVEDRYEQTEVKGQTDRNGLR